MAYNYCDSRHTIRETNSIDAGYLLRRYKGAPMSDSRSLSRYDLNMLVALDALLTERHVTRAAERMDMSQAAMSAAHGRLRSRCDDTRRYRGGNSYELPPISFRLIDQLPSALNRVRR